MSQDEPLLVVVPTKQGVDALASITGVTAVLVEPKQPIPPAAKAADVLVVGPVEQQEEVDDALRQINQLPQIKLLQTLGQGVEQWDGLLPDGLILSSAGGAHGGSTAEWTVMALLAQVRELPRYIKNQQQHTWEGHRARTLLQANVLIYGVGDLGKNIKSRLVPFDAQITMVGTHSRDNVVDAATARALLPKTDAVIIALPLTPATRHMVDADFLALLPDRAIVINPSRGDIVDQAALIKELENGRLLAALDVMTPEPLPVDIPLWDAPGLLLTPHVGGNTNGADDRAWQVVTEKIRDYMQGSLNE